MKNIPIKKLTEPQLLLRLGLAFVFAYAAIAATITPENWIGYLPQFMRHILPAQLLLNVFSAFEAVLALWLLSGFKVFYASLIAALTLLGVIVFNLGAFDITFRDVAIVFAALALASLSKEKSIRS